MDRMDKKLVFLSILLSCCSYTLGSNESPLVEVQQGAIRGQIEKSRSGREFFSFLGIPYGQAERFQAPTAADKWNGTFEATEYGPQCAQKMWITNENIGEENCLHLQVFTPSLTDNAPVMVYFHGGGFTVGTGNVLKPQYFMDENVVLVLVNYRLGPFGFLSMQDENIPGNNGLKDQNLALKWVQQNIVRFGGDAGRVTLFGNSAGGASASFHVLSQQSSGLFHSAILQSGCALNPWAMSNYPKAMALKYGTHVGCSTENSAEFLRCLRAKSTAEILNAMEPLTQWNVDPFTPFGVVVEPDVPGAFIITDPLESMRSGNFNKVPIITGLTEDEGILLFSAYILKHPKLLQDLNEKWSDVIPVTLQFDNVYTNFTGEQQAAISAEVRKYYFNNRPVTEEYRQQLTNAYSDRLFNNGVKKCAISMAEHTPVYLYQFAHNRGDYSILRWFGIEEVFGVSHADEVSFQFAESYGIAPEFQKVSASETVSRNFVKLWASFAAERRPTKLWGNQQEWESISRDERDGKNPLKYYRIDVDTSIIDEPFADRYKFWEDILSRHHQ